MDQEPEDVSQLDGLDIQVITITYSEDDTGPPQVDLGLTNPWLAITLLRQVAEALEMTLLPPTIRYNNRTIFEAVGLDLPSED